VRTGGSHLAGGRHRRRPAAPVPLRRVRARRRGRRHRPGVLADRPGPSPHGPRPLTPSASPRPKKDAPTAGSLSGGIRLSAREGGQDQAATTASISRVMRTLSPTSTPPVSRAAFQVRSNSLRETSVLAEKPTREAPKGSVAAPLYSTSRAAGLVTPLMVRSP